VFWHNVRMPDENSFTLRQVDQARGDLYGIDDNLEFLKIQIARLPTRAYVSRIALMATGTVWALIIAVAMMFAR
jgi:hypothetical protein